MGAMNSQRSLHSGDATERGEQVEARVFVMSAPKCLKNRGCACCGGWIAVGAMVSGVGAAAACGGKLVASEGGWSVEVGVGGMARGKEVI